MVHADASNFKDNVTKEEAYAQVLAQAESLMEGQRNWVCNLANAASLLWHAYHSLTSPSNEVNWAGFYVLDARIKNQLILGPFHGKVACQTISFSRGVCGAAARTATTQLVDDVEKFPGHIACDSESKSEIVVPIFAECSGSEEEDSVLVNGDRWKNRRGRVVGIIDIDCRVDSGFDEVDRVWLERLAVLIGRGCDWPRVEWEEGEIGR